MTSNQYIKVLEDELYDYKNKLVKCVVKKQKKECVVKKQKKEFFLKKIIKDLEKNMKNTRKKLYNLFFEKVNYLGFEDGESTEAAKKNLKLGIDERTAKIEKQIEFYKDEYKKIKMNLIELKVKDKRIEGEVEKLLE